MEGEGDPLVCAVADEQAVGFNVSLKRWEKVLLYSAYPIFLAGVALFFLGFFIQELRVPILGTIMSLVSLSGVLLIALALFNAAFVAYRDS